MSGQAAYWKDNNTDVHYFGRAICFLCFGEFKLDILCYRPIKIGLIFVLYSVEIHQRYITKGCIIKTMKLLNRITSC